MFCRGLVGALAAALLLPAGAWAGTASILRNTLRYDAAAGEANTVVVAEAGGDFWVLDDSATVVAGPGCTSVSAGFAKCDGQGVRRLLVLAGDGDDEAANSTQLASTIRGGDGDDLLMGGGNANELHGNVGDDELVGGRFDDLLDGGPGTDDLLGDPPGTPEGRGGFDTASYKFRANGVRVTLDDQANDGEPGEADNVHENIEIVQGGRGGDRLVGNDAFVNGLLGGPGDDVLLGGAAAGFIDVLVGQAGRDVISGGPSFGFLTGGKGDDAIRGGRDADAIWGDRGDDDVHGGTGDDDLWGGVGHDTLVGAGGRDQLTAVDGQRDRLFGGPGRDRAFLDSRVDIAVSVERYPTGDEPRNARPAARPSALRAVFRTLARP